MEKAKNFKANALVAGEEKKIELIQFEGKKIVLYFYPKDLTPGCTLQSCNLRDNYELLQQHNMEIIGVSKDSIQSHRRFADKKNLPFILVSDEDLSINKLYDVWKEKSFMGRKFMGTVRTTFLINGGFEIVKVINKPQVSLHSQEILDFFKIYENRV